MSERRETMTNEEGDHPTGLECLAGEPAPAVIRQGFEALRALPDATVRDLWPLVEAALQSVDGDGATQLLQYFSQQHGADPALVLAAVRSCDYVLRNAAALDLPAAAFQGDLETLGPGHAAPAQLLMPVYAEAVRWLRQRILEDTLADHGRVLTGVDWRLDHVRASNRGAGLDARIAYLRLTYRQGTATRSLSLQLTPAGVATLGSLCSDFDEGG